MLSGQLIDYLLRVNFVADKALSALGYTGLNYFSKGKFSHEKHRLRGVAGRD